jgi:S-DNA-T family DNA segregation ATPase FtsK/SpoIIIE
VAVRWTVLEPARPGTRADVLVEAPAGARLQEAGDLLLAAVGRPSPGARPPAFFVDGEPVNAVAIGRPPLLEGAVVTLGRPGGPPGRAAGTAGGLLEVHVTSGPDAGTRLPLGVGTVCAGRAGSAGLRVDDPDVSRLHVQVVHDGTTVLVRDAGSTNGTLLDGEPVGSGTRAWPVGGRLQLGGSTLVLRACDGDPAGGGGPASTHPDGAGRLLVNPAPRLPGPPPTAQVTFPGLPEDPPRSRLPWVAAVVPLAVCLPVAWWLRQPGLLAFTALSPVMLIVQYLTERRTRRLEHEAAGGRHAARLARAEARLQVCLAAEALRLRLDHPDLAAIGAAAAGPLQRLWDRRRPDDDVLVLRAGLGERDAATTVSGDSAPSPPPRLTDVPVTVDLRAAGVTGIAGPRHEVLGLTRALIGQAAVRHSPRDLRVVVLTAAPAAARDWSWARWLPHADGDLPLITTPGAALWPAGPQEPAAVARTLLVLDGAEPLRRRSEVAALLSGGARSGVLCLALADDPSRLPAECGVTVELGSGGARLTLSGQIPVDLQPDLASPAWSERLARDLARLRDGTPDAGDPGLPAQVRLPGLLRPGDTASLDPRSIAAGWRQRRSGRSPATTAAVGRTMQGVWELDLGRDGPHVLVAGTTGAGKSELLTSLVAGLAATHPPDRLQFLLVDYKGGTAFAPLARLPHVAGVITDLDGGLAHRALTSLRAELRRREALLRAAGAADLDRYDTTRTGAAGPLARLVIVVDEFRVLAEELPDLLTGLVRIAAVGRSLGVHLVLATQRPAGVISADIRANVNLRIALRVRDRSDSEDVIDAPDAALLPAGRPGRGLFRAGGGEPVLFQAARVTGQSSAAPVAISVRRLRPDDAVPTRWLPDAAGRQGSGQPPAPADDDLTLLVEACRSAALADGLQPAAAPWLPPLPAVVRADEVHRVLTGEARPRHPTTSGAQLATSGARLATSSARLAVGVIDRPQEQRRAPLIWDAGHDGHLAIAGAPGSGRTTALRTIVSAALEGPSPCHVHVLDGGGRLRDLEALPGVGTVAPVTDVERVDRLLRHLSQEGDAMAGDAPPAVLLLVDGWEQALDAWYPIEHGRLADDLVRLARDGASRRTRIAVTGGRAVLSGPLGSLLTQRWLLRTADPTDLVVAGVPASSLPADMPPGRVLRVVAGAAEEAQVALLDPLARPSRPSPQGTGPPPAGDRPATGFSPPPGSSAASGRPPLRLRQLPSHVDLGELLAAGGSAPVLGPGGPGYLPVGLGGDDAAPDGPPAGGPGWLVAGAVGSGRSTALAVAGRMLLAGGRPVITLARHDPLTGLARHGAVVVDPVVAPGALLARLDAVPGATLLVDDASWLAGPLDELLLGRLDERDRGGEREPSSHDGGLTEAGGRWPGGTGPHILAGCTPGQAAVSFRGVLPRLRDRRTGLLLGAVAPGDGEALGVQVPARPAGPPGRALLVVGGRIRAIQLAAVTRVPALGREVTGQSTLPAATRCWG